MKFGTVLKRIWHKIVQPSSRSQVSPAERRAVLSPETQAMLEGLIDTRAEELSCDEVFELLDIFAEAVQNGEDAATLMPLVQQHLDMCPECREEYEVLLASMQATGTG